MNNYFVYILTSKTGTLYIGVTNDLQRRIYEHRYGLIEGFTKRYSVTKLVYYEETPDVNEALTREKEIKKWRRSRKIDLIKSMNSEWKDLSEGWFDEDE